MSWEQTFMQDQRQEKKQAQKKMVVTESAMMTAQIERDISLEEKRELQNLHSEMNELTEMLGDMNSLVDKQGGQIDLIEDNVTNSVRHVQKGREHIKKASNMQKAGSKGVMNCFSRRSCCVGEGFSIMKKIEEEVEGEGEEDPTNDYLGVLKGKDWSEYLNENEELESTVRNKDERRSGPTLPKYVHTPLFRSDELQFSLRTLFNNLFDKNVKNADSHSFKNVLCDKPRKSDTEIRAAPPIIRDMARDGELVFFCLDRTVLYFRLSCREVGKSDDVESHVRGRNMYYLKLISQYTFPREEKKNLKKVASYVGKIFLDSTLSTHKMIRKMEIQRKYKRLVFLYDRKLYTLSYTGALNPDGTEVDAREFYRSCRKVGGFDLKFSGIFQSLKHKPKDIAVDKKDDTRILVLCAKNIHKMYSLGKVIQKSGLRRREYSIFIISRIDKHSRVPKKSIRKVDFSQLPGDVSRMEFYGHNIVLSLQTQYVILNDQGRTIFNSKKASSFCDEVKRKFLDKLGGSFRSWPEKFDTIEDQRFRHLVRIVGTDLDIFRNREIHDGRKISPPKWVGEAYDMGYCYPLVCYVPEGEGKHFQFFSTYENRFFNEESIGVHNKRIPVCMSVTDENVCVVYCHESAAEKKKKVTKSGKLENHDHEFYCLKVFTPASFYDQKVRMVWKFVGSGKYKRGIKMKKKDSPKRIFQDVMKLHEYDYEKRMKQIIGDIDMESKEIQRTMKLALRKEEDEEEQDKIRSAANNDLEDIKRRRMELCYDLAVTRDIETMRVNLHMAFAMLLSHRVEKGLEYYFDSHMDCRYLISLFRLQNDKIHEIKDFVEMGMGRTPAGDEVKDEWEEFDDMPSQSQMDGSPNEDGKGEDGKGKGDDVAVEGIDALKGTIADVGDAKVNREKKKLMYFYEFGGKKLSKKCGQFKTKQHQLCSYIFYLAEHELFDPLGMGLHSHLTLEPRNETDRKNLMHLIRFLRRAKSSLERNTDVRRKKKHLISHYLNASRRMIQRSDKLRADLPNKHVIRIKHFLDMFDRDDESLDKNVERLIDEEKICIDNMVVFLSSKLKDRDMENKEFYEDVLTECIRNEKVHNINLRIVENMKYNDTVSYLRIKWNADENDVKKRMDYIEELVENYWEYYRIIQMQESSVEADKRKKEEEAIRQTEELKKFVIEILYSVKSSEFEAAKHLIYQYVMTAVHAEGSKVPSYSTFAKTVLRERRDLLELARVFISWFSERTYDIDMITPPEIIDFLGTFPRYRPGCDDEALKLMVVQSDPDNMEFSDNMDGAEIEERLLEEYDLAFSGIRDLVVDTRRKDGEVDGDRVGMNEVSNMLRRQKEMQEEEEVMEMEEFNNEEENEESSDESEALEVEESGGQGRAARVGVSKGGAYLGMGMGGASGGGGRGGRSSNKKDEKEYWDVIDEKVRKFKQLRCFVEKNHRTFVEIEYMEGIRSIIEEIRTNSFEDYNRYFLPPIKTTMSNLGSLHGDEEDDYDYDEANESVDIEYEGEEDVGESDIESADEKENNNNNNNNSADNTSESESETETETETETEMNDEEEEEEGEEKEKENKTEQKGTIDTEALRDVRTLNQKREQEEKEDQKLKKHRKDELIKSETYQMNDVRVKEVPEYLSNIGSEDVLMRSYDGMLFLLIRKYLYLLSLCDVGGDFLYDLVLRCKDLIESDEFNLVRDIKIKKLLDELSTKIESSSSSSSSEETNSSASGVVGEMKALLLTRKRRANLKHALMMKYERISKTSIERDVADVFDECEEICLDLFRDRWSHLPKLERPVANSYFTDLLVVAFEKFKLVKSNVYFERHLLDFLSYHSEQIEFSRVVHRFPVNWDLSMVCDIFNKKIIHMHEEIRKSEARIKVLKMLKEKKRKDLVVAHERYFQLDGTNRCVVCNLPIYETDVFLVYPNVNPIHDLKRFVHAECGVDEYKENYKENIFPADNPENIEYDPLDLND